MGTAVVLTLLTSFAALVLGVTLHALTRDEDPDLALLGMACRIGEGVLGALPVSLLGMSWLATAGVTPEAANTLATFLLKFGGWKTTVGAMLFAVGSALFSWLMLRGRIIPEALAWVGVFASLLLVAALPLRLAGGLHSPVTDLVWIPMAAFEIPLALWLIVKGAAAPRAREAVR
jgi:hypothetical protein